MLKLRTTLSALALLFGTLAATAPASALPNADCKTTGTFDGWLATFKQQAAAQGVSQRTINAALNGVTYDARIIKKDRAQGVFRQSFEQFSGRMIPPRVARARAMLKQYAGPLAKIEQTYGVPKEVVVALWGLETDFGAAHQNEQIIRSLASLAYDCRRSEMFTNQLIAALKVIDRGDLTVAEMRGGWAGELGQTQFLPTSYYNFAVDFDGNGKADLLRSPTDVLASTANFLKGHGWRPGASYEVGGPNYQVLNDWNRSEVYRRTVAAFADRLAGGA
jgi:lytic murein transglycosylase